MSHSEDDDDFLSADEDVDDCFESHDDKKKSCTKTKLDQTNDAVDQDKDLSSSKIIDADTNRISCRKDANLLGNTAQEKPPSNICDTKLQASEDVREQIIEPTPSTTYRWRIPHKGNVNLPSADAPAAKATISESIALATTTTTTSKSKPSSTSQKTEPIKLLNPNSSETNEPVDEIEPVRTEAVKVDTKASKQIESKADVSTTKESCKSSEQARLALDRLSEKLSQTEKNLFERVASDIRNMSITDDGTITAADVTSQLNALPATITDLGSTLGGWGWSGATKLFSSATQVTFQVGSVLNSIVDVSQQPQSSLADNRLSARSLHHNDADSGRSGHSKDD